MFPTSRLVLLAIVLVTVCNASNEVVDSETDGREIEEPTIIPDEIQQCMVEKCGDSTPQEVQKCLLRNCATLAKRWLDMAQYAKRWLDSGHYDKKWLDSTHYDKKWLDMSQYAKRSMNEDKKWLDMSQYAKRSMDKKWLDMSQYAKRSMDKKWLDMSQYKKRWLDHSQYEKKWLDMSQYTKRWLDDSQYTDDKRGGGSEACLQRCAKTVGEEAMEECEKICSRKPSPSMRPRAALHADKKWVDPLNYGLLDRKRSNYERFSRCFRTQCGHLAEQNFHECVRSHCMHMLVAPADAV